MMQVKDAVLFKTNSFRRIPLLESLRQWLLLKNFQPKMLTPEELVCHNWQNTAFLYIPLLWDLSFLKDVPEYVPIVIDYDGAGELKPLSLLQNRRYAFRRAFGGQTIYSPELQVPYVHKPIHHNQSQSKDTIIVDLHYWLSIPCQLSFTALLTELNAAYEQICERIQKKVKFYFTSFVSPDPYNNTAKYLLNALPQGVRHANSISARSIENALTKIQENLIAPLQSHADFQNLFSKGLLFISDNADLADQDINHCLATDTPIWVVSRSPLKDHERITYTLWESLSLLIPEFSDFLDRVEDMRIRPSQDVSDIILQMGAPYSAFDILNKAYDATWECILEWTMIGKKFPEISEAIDQASLPHWRCRHRWNNPFPYKKPKVQ